MSNFTIYIFLFFLLSCSNAFSQGNWVLKKEKDGIKVYTRRSQYSKFNEIKAEFTIKTSMRKFTSVISDIDKYPLWVYGTKTALLCKRLSDEDVIYYSEVNVPWPISNRDFYSRLKIHQDTIQKSVTIIAAAIPDFRPPKDGIVRVPRSSAKWTVTSVDNSTLNVVYIVAIDPGGNFPAWIANMFSTKGPIESFINLRERCK
jgi:START domain